MIVINKKKLNILLFFNKYTNFQQNSKCKCRISSHEKKKKVKKYTKIRFDTIEIQMKSHFNDYK